MKDGIAGLKKGAIVELPFSIAQLSIKYGDSKAVIEGAGIIKPPADPEQGIKGDETPNDPKGLQDIPEGLAPIGQALPEDFPHREKLIESGFDTVEKVKGAEDLAGAVSGIGPAKLEAIKEALKTL